MARSLMYLSIAGAIISFASLVLPHDHHLDEYRMALVGASSLAIALVIALGRNALPSWSYQVFVAASTLLVEWEILASGQDASPYAAVYFWIAIYSFYFFTRRQAILQMLFIVAAYAAVLAFIGEPTSGPVVRWVITMSALSVSGAMIGVLQERVMRLARDIVNDSSTDLGNRRGFTESLENEVDRARRYELPVSVAVVAIDGLTEDGPLKELGALVRKLVRTADTAARIAPDAIGLVLPHTDADGGLVFCERSRRAIAEGLAEAGLDASVSVGLACFPKDGTTAEALLHGAQQAVSAADHLGRDRVVVYSPEIASIVLAAESRRGESRGGNLAAVLALTEVLDIRDAGTAQHSQTVGRYAEAIARALGLTDGLVERIRLAGILHDVGKIAVPDAVLSKPGKLDEAEWAQMRKHPEVGALIVDGAELKDVAAWVLAHHERPDGGGYPRALSGDQIPLEARILAVADSYEAMTCDRVYRRALSTDVAREELRRCAGTQFDERVVEVFLHWLGEADARGASPEGGNWGALVRGLNSVPAAL
jgi:diguanylate cyclase (GGDEF)-like protein/putative nucleotidyltransferase with HDIG domain